MNIYEAALAAKAGKKVIHSGMVAQWVGRLNWVGIGGEVPVTELLLKGWSIVEEPPKEYTFAEAYEMMKAGKWMKSLKSELYYQHRNPYWNLRANESLDSSRAFLSTSFSAGEIEGKWIEVNP